MLEFSEIIVDFQFLPILHKRFVVDEFSVKGIDWGTKRKRSGFLPPEPKSKEPSIFSAWIDEAFSEIENEFEKMPVSKLVDFEVPKNPKEVLALLDLESEKAFKDAAIKFQESRGEWTTRVKDLRDISEYERMIKEVRTLAKGVPNDPQEILKRVETIKKTVDFFEDQKKQVEGLVKEVKDEWTNLNSVYDSAMNAIQSDYNKAKGMVSLDQFNVENLSRLMFGPAFLDYYHMALKAQAKLRQVQSVLKDEKDESVEVKPRAQGRDIIFVKAKRLPGFVLAKSEFSVTGLEKAAANRLSQRYEVKLEDINSAPRLWGKPTHVNINGQFREFIMSRADLDLLWDYTTDVPKDRYRASVQRLKADDWTVGIPKVFPLKMESAHADIKTELKFEGDQMSWVNRIEFSDVKWDFKEIPRVGFIVRALSDVFQRVKDFHLEIALKKEAKKLAFDVKSNLDNLLRDGVEAEIKEKLTELQAKLKEEIERRVAQYKNKALAELKGFEKDARDQVQGRLSKLLAYQDEAEKKIKELQNAAKKGAQDKAKKEIQKNLGKPLKGLKLPGL